jgi:hypothetical protein
MYHDPEIEALSKVNEALTGLNTAQVKRIAAWVTGRFGLDRPEGSEGLAEVIAGAGEMEPSPPLVKKRRGRIPRAAKSQDAAAGPTTAAPVKFKGFMKYESLEALVKAKGDKLKRVSAKLLVVAAFLQERENYKEMSSYDITSKLKSLDMTIKNASISIKNMMLRKPPLLMQMGSFGTGAKARRKFRVTEAGLNKAREYID